MENSVKKNLGIFKFIVYSGLGIFMFFVKITINGESVIPVQHIINFIKWLILPYIPYYALAMITIGGISPFITGNFKKSRFDFIFSVIKLIGVIIGFMAVFNFGPKALMEPNMIPFLLNSIVIPIALSIPATGLAFVLLLNFGLMEFISVFMQPVMRKIWKTPGQSAIDAVVSFTGGYALAVLLTNELYKKGIYSRKESVIIATGFSTVAISFLVVIANTLELMDYWNLYFFACFFITFLVTAITARIYPISKIPNDYYDKKAEIKTNYEEGIFKRAYNSAVEVASNAKPLPHYLKKYYLGDALKMASAVTASILTIGLAGVLLAEYTPVFELIGYLFYPFTLLLRIPDPLLAAKASAIEIAEMFLPALLVVNSHIITKFTIAVTSVTAILFASASIPCLLSTDIKISIKDILLIWIERTILSLIFAGLLAHIVF